MGNISKLLGNRIKELRKSKKLTQQKLAELISVEPVTIARIESGSRFPQKETLENIANALAVEIKDLFDYKHLKTKEVLLKEINKLISSANVNDLNYLYRIITFYFESK